MPLTLMRRCFRERRRVALVIVLIFASLQLAGAGGRALPLPLPPPLSLSAAAVAVAAGLLLGLISVSAPRLRGFSEATALGSLAFAGLTHALPGSLLDLAGPRGNVFVAVGVWLGLVALARAARDATGALPLPRLRNCRFKARAGSRVDIFRLWYGLVPTPEQAARYGDPDLVAIETMSLRLGRVRLVTQTAPEPPREAHLQILEVEAPFHIRLRACEADGRGVLAATGISEIFLVELGRQRLVLFAHDFPEMPLGRALLAWLDDRPGRMLDHRLATIERRFWSEDADLDPVPQAGGTGKTQPTGWRRAS